MENEIYSVLDKPDDYRNMNKQLHNCLNSTRGWHANTFAFQINTDERLYCDVIIVKHGKEYDEEAEFLDEYPIAICPECLSSATYVIRPNASDKVLFRDYVTGLYRHHEKGMFVVKQVNVNYRCDSCGCAFRKWYDVKEGKTQVSGKYSAIIITGLILVFSIVAAICAKEAEEGVLLSNGGYYTDGFMCWVVGSLIVAVVSFIAFACLCSILWGERS